MKIDPRLPQLPALSELLEHPRVKGLVARVNRSTIAKRAGAFLEEVRSSLAERAGRAEIPSLTHLAERLARRLLGESPAGGTVINATGLVLGDPRLAPPLAEAALHAMVQLAGEYHRRDTTLVHAAERGLAELAGAEAALIASSLEGALTLACAAHAGNRELVVCGGEASEGVTDWRRLAVRAGAVLRVVSSESQQTELGAAAVVRTPEAAAVDIQTLASGNSEGRCVIDAAIVAGTINPRDHGYDSIETIGERLMAGADLVVVEAAGLLGGPACGLVFGSRQRVEPLAHSPSRRLWPLTRW